MKTKIILCALVAIFSLSGCGIIKIVYHTITSTDSDYITPKQEAEILCQQVLDCVQNADQEKLKNLFCKKLQKTHELCLDKEISEFFNFIDGEIISHDEPYGFSGAGRSTPKDGRIVHEIQGEIRNIKTDTGRTYFILFNAYRVFKSNEDLLGITWLKVIDGDEYAIKDELEKGDSYTISMENESK